MSRVAAPFIAREIARRDGIVTEAERVLELDCDGPLPDSVVVHVDGETRTYVPENGA